MATERPRTVTTRRELTLPPEIVTLIRAFKPEEGHTPPYPRVPWGHYPGQAFFTNLGDFYDCCGGFTTSSTCTLFAEGMYHPGTVEKWTRVTRLEHGKSVGHPGQKLGPGRMYVDPILRWSCCGAVYGRNHNDYFRPPPGCTRLDLTLRITNITRPSQADAEQNT